MTAPDTAAEPNIIPTALAEWRNIVA